ncbi:MAG TPA: hypothetical protein VG733_08350, partial [Chthoniobacteraceae bacterium]|nr:hypothetical protein [Chthoniobacteraceae bacterium]
MNTKLSFVRSILPLAALALLAPWASRADDATDAQKSQAFAKAVQQDNLAKEMSSIQAELASMHEEMKQLLPQDVGMIDKAFGQIDSLSANEMKSTLESLRDAARSGDLKGQLEKLADAYKGQTDAIHKMKDISGELAARGIRDDLTVKLTELLKREVVDMDEVNRLGQVSQTPGGLRDRFQQRYQVVFGDQSTVSDDVKGTITSINDSAANLPEDSRKFLTVATGIATQNRLADNASGAVVLTQNGPFAQAVSAQASVVDTLAMMV